MWDLCNLIYAVIYKKPETKSFEKKPDTNDFIYVPSIDLYVDKERTHLGENWKDCWTELQKDNYKMLKINEFIVQDINISLKS